MKALGRGRFSLCRNRSAKRPWPEPDRHGKVQGLPGLRPSQDNAVGWRPDGDTNGVPTGPSAQARSQRQRWRFYPKRATQKAAALSSNFVSNRVPFSPAISLRHTIVLLLFIVLLCGSVSAEGSAAHHPRRLSSRPRMRFQRDGLGDASSTKKPETHPQSTRATHATTHTTKTPAHTKSDDTSQGHRTKPKHTRSSSTSRQGGGLLTAPSAQSSPLPSAFDASIGSNFTTSACETWFQSFTASEEFVSCHPFSLLLQTSTSFFEAEKSLVTTTTALDASCHVDFSHCLGVMDGLAADLQSDEYCASDLANGNPLIVQALGGFRAYGPMYQTGCLNNAQGGYCFADAISNVQSPTDPYVYQIGLGVSLPAGTRPTCNGCLKKTMNIFRTAAGNESQPVSQTYVTAAQQINLQCGPNFANTTVLMATGAAVPSHSLGAAAPLLTLFALVGALFV